MRLTQDSYWQSLGIPLWKLRDVSSATPQYKLLLNNRHEKLAILVVEHNSSEEEELFGNIITALEAKIESLGQEQLASYSDLACFIFGGHLQKFVANISWAERDLLCSLQAMLQDPSLKKEVWQKLRKFKST